MRRYAKAFLSAAFVAIVMGIVFCVYRLFPFGQNSLTWCDMSQQVIPFSLELKDVFAGKSSFVFNLKNAGGMNFLGIYLFFISSPFSFLVAFVNKLNISLFMNILVVLKMMCCAFSANIYFLNRFKSLNDKIGILLSVTYAFCGYSMMFYQNVVWLDIMYLFPLLLLSLERLIEFKKFTMFIFVFSGVIIINFYLSYMIIIFLIILMGVHLFFSYKESNIKDIITLFSVSGIISIMLTCPVWLTSFFQYYDSARTGNLIDNITEGAFIAPIYTTIPFVFCTPIIFAAIPFLVFNFKNLSKKIKCYFAVFLLTFIPIIVDPINKMWHTGSYMAFPVRYGYITIFLGLILVASILNEKLNNEKITIKKKSIFVLSVSLFMFLFSTTVILLFAFDKVSAYTKFLWGNRTSFLYLFLVFLVSVMCCFLYIYMYKKKMINKNFFIIFICFLSIIQAFFNSAVYVGSASNSTNNYKSIVDLSEKISDDEFYRLKLNKKYFEVNFLGGIGYNCLDHYTSLTSKDYMFAMKKLGYSSYWMEVSSVGGTKFTDMLLSNKYIVKKINDLTSSDCVVYKNNYYAIIKNENSLPLAVKTAGDLCDCKELEHKNRFLVQEDILKKLFKDLPSPFYDVKYCNTENLNYSWENGIYNLLKIDDLQKSYIDYSVEISEKSTLYFDCFMDLSNRLKEPINNSFRVTVNNKQIENLYPNSKNNGILDLGTFENETVNINIELLKNVCCKSFGVNLVNLNTLNNIANNIEPANLKIKNNTIEGEITANAGECVYIEIPYNKGFRAKINNKDTEIVKVNDAFMAIKLVNGNNKIKISFVPNGLIEGAVIFGVGVLIFILMCFVLKNKKLKFNKNLSLITLQIFNFLFMLVIFTIYILPVAIYIIF